MTIMTSTKEIPCGYREYEVKEKCGGAFGGESSTWNFGIWNLKCPLDSEYSGLKFSRKAEKRTFSL